VSIWDDECELTPDSCRHGDRLESVHGTDRSIHLGRTRLHGHQRRNRASGLSSRACVHLCRTLQDHGRGKRHLPSTTDLRRTIYDHTRRCDAVLLASKGRPGTDFDRGHIADKAAQVPPYVFPLLIASKRLHSIFVLRCFNDCFAALFLWLAILCFQRKFWTIGVLAYSWGLGTKMSLLLVLPAVAVILFQGRGVSGSLTLVMIMLQHQIAIANPFLKENWKGYLSRAFELSRQFFFKWTVNWRFVGEDMFLSRSFALTLLVLHALVLAAFMHQKWLRPALSRKPLSALVGPILQFSSPFGSRDETLVASAIKPQYVMTTVLSANVIGLLFARSLHYQFYAYLAWATPYLLWRSGAHPIVQYGFWALQEWAWNVFPSTPVSSAVVVGVLAATVALGWVAGGKEPVPGPDPLAQDPQAKKTT
jgi:alpha-1,3-mannosyltransferase